MLMGCGAPRAQPGGQAAAEGEAMTRTIEPGGSDQLRAPAFPIEEVAKYPLPGLGKQPGSFAFAPDGDVLTFLWSEEGTLVRELWALDLATGERKRVFAPPEGGATEANLSPEEKLRRERMRERGLGVTSYQWAKRAQKLLVPVRGDLWIQDGVAGPPRKLVDAGDKPAISPQLSRDGAHVAYVLDDELYVVATAGGPPKQLTSGARGTGRTNGLAEYVAQEEMGRHQGFWWSHDASKLAYTEVDETHIPVFRIAHEARDAPSFEDHRYPFAGAANAKVRLGVIARGGGETTWMDLAMDGESEPPYLARVHWMPDGSLLAELENRAQTRLDLVRLDLATGARKVLLTERSEVWINLHDDFEPLENGEGELAGGFVWASERTGFRHLYLYAGDGRLIRPLTAGDWLVDGVAGIDEARKLVYFVASKDGPTQRQLYRVALDGGEIERITEAPGSHSVTLDRKQERWVDVHADLGAPPTATVRSLVDRTQARPIEIEPDPRVAELGLLPPELTTVETADGTTLHVALYRPPEGAAPPPWPTIVSVYGGPHAQRVTQSWDLTVDMRAQYLRELGWLVIKVDNRGSARRGLAFEGAIKGDLGNLELTDQVEAIRVLAERGLVDPARVGIYGWSYGGYMSAMALVRAPDTFKVGVAGAPVTSWDGYDTHYTERYMGTPQGNPKGYASSSVMTHVENLRGHLMLVHGMIDENVHFRHTARLIQALIRARKPYELLPFPDERHMPRGEADRVYMEQRIVDFFREHL
jgi:dipeptidyl-peptidase-4